MYKKKILLIATACLLLKSIMPAQDIHFSQFNFSPLDVNPALTAAYKDMQATVNYKDQWQVLNAFRTAAATFEIKTSQFPWTRVKNLTNIFKEKFSKGLGVGLGIFSDKAGDGSLMQTQINLSIAYHTMLNEKNTLSGGIMGSLIQRSISPAGLRWGNQYSGGAYNPNLPTGENFATTAYWSGDIAAGLMWSYGEGSRYLTANDQRFFNAGISLYHINKPNQSFLGKSDNLNWRWTAHASALIGINNSQISVGPSVLYMRQGVLSELTFGSLLKYKFKDESRYTGYVKGAAISVGCFYRNKDAVIPMLLLELAAYSVGITYDTNISGLTAATSGRGGFEISLRFNSPNGFLYQNDKSRF